MKYIESKKKMEGCVFCNTLNDVIEHDRENYLVYRGPTTFTVMNIYPYNPGHLMVLPNQHVATLVEVSREAQLELITLTSYFTKLLSQVMNPQGFNIGLNIGQAAGAGIDSHLHLHIVPRWNGDSNFMPVTGNTRVLPEALEDTYDKIVAALQENPPDRDNQK
jgi:ATP adenylyltransferase